MLKEVVLKQLELDHMLKEKVLKLGGIIHMLKDVVPKLWGKDHMLKVETQQQRRRNQFFADSSGTGFVPLQVVDKIDKRTFPTMPVSIHLLKSK